jgi:hypothetical protein
MESILDLLVRENEDKDFDLHDTVRERAAQSGWSDILTAALDILEQPDNKAYWRQATAIIFWAVGAKAEMPKPKMEVVARLYWCLAKYPGFGGSGMDDGENLVWSIASHLKGVGYLSDWQPLDDPEVRLYLVALQ